MIREINKLKERNKQCLKETKKVTCEKIVCPQCFGDGYYRDSDYESDTCPLCLGDKIIWKITEIKYENIKND